MPVTIKYDDFKSKTSRSFPRYRSKRLDHVLACFKKLEEHTTQINEVLLRRALVTWMVTDPKEYAKRDSLSNKLCTKLAKELGATKKMDGANKGVISAHLLTKVTNGNAGVRTVAKSQWLKCSMEDYMLKLFDEGSASSTCVIVIDMQAKDGSGLPSGETCYNSDSVIGNQESVLMAAAEYGMNVIEIRIATTINAKDTSDGPVTKRVHNDPTLPVLVQAMKHSKAKNFVSITKPYYNSFQSTNLAEELKNRGIKLAIVMGFDANLCVRNTIFGTPTTKDYSGPNRPDQPYRQGILDRDISVLTSRVVLASSYDAALEWNYGMTG